MAGTVSRSFEQPLHGPLADQEQLETLIPAIYSSAPLHFAADPGTTALVANPGYNAESISFVHGAVVKITGPEQGSGFITLDKHGNQVIVTAAHVVGTHDVDDIELTDVQGNRTSAQAGRYIFEDPGSLHDVRSHEMSVEIDLAVLRPKERIGQTSLQIGSLAARGSWLDMINFQRDAPFDAPYQYKGVSLTQLPGRKNFVLTGMEPERSNEPKGSTVLLGGSSGGVVFDPQSRTIAGLSYFASTILLQPDGQEMFSISFEQPTRATDYKSDITPLLGHMLDPQYIHTIIETLPEAQ